MKHSRQPLRLSTKTARRAAPVVLFAGLLLTAACGASPAGASRPSVRATATARAASAGQAVTTASAARASASTGPAGQSGAGTSAAGQSGAHRSAAWRPVHLPPGFQPFSASFVSARSGFVLGTAGCRHGEPCPARLVATTDGGAHWRFLTAPPVTLPLSASGFSTWVNAVSSVLFASRRDGWLYGPALWATHDGGAHWQRLSPHLRIQSMAAGAGTVYAVGEPRLAGPNDWELFRSPVTADAWARAGQMTGTLGTVAVSGRSAWVPGGTYVWATSDGVNWQRYPFQCPGKYYGLSGMAAASPTQVLFLCIDSADFDMATEGIEIMSSTDGGKTSHLAGRQAPVFGDGVIAVPPQRPGVITFATSPGVPAYLDRSGDGGKTWTQVEYPSGGTWQSVSYVSRTVGWAVLGMQFRTYSGRLLRTTDAGITWR